MPFEGKGKFAKFCPKKAKVKNRERSMNSEASSLHNRIFSLHHSQTTVAALAMRALKKQIEKDGVKRPRNFRILILPELSK